MSERIVAAFGYAAEKFLRRFGDGPYDGLLSIGNKDDKGFSMVANITKKQEEIDGIGFGNIVVHRNGWPVGVISPFGGMLLGSSSPGEAEGDFIQWCREDEEVCRSCEKPMTNQGRERGQCDECENECVADQDHSSR